MRFSRTICYLAAVLLVMLLTACGSSSSSKSSGAFITGGKAVDPYIVGATFFEDVNGNGRWDQGEQISTASDEDGTFTFTSPVPAGRTIIMHDRGTHNGLKFTGVLARKILNSDAGLVVVSPLTTLQALGLSSAEIVDLLQESIPALDESHVTADPYASLNLFKEEMAIDDASLAGIRANVLVSVLFQLSQPMGSWLDISEGELEELLSGLYFDADQQASIVEAVRHALHPDALRRIRNAMPSDPDVTVTMRDVADTVPAITSWWLQKYLDIILENIWSGVGLGELTAQIDRVQGDLGYHYVKKNNPDSFPEFSGDHVYLAEDETVVDGSLKFTSALVSDKAFSIGEALLLFDNDGTLQIITSNDSDSGSETEIEDARWEINANGDLLLSASQDESLLAQISLIADWSSHIHIQVQGPMADEDGYIMNLPLAKARLCNQEELTDSHFIIEDNQLGTITGGHLDLDNVPDVDAPGDGILVYYPDGDEEIPFDWHIDKYNGLVVDTGDQIDTIYRFNSNGTNTLMLSEYDVITELEDELKLYRPLLLTQDDITEARFYSGASGYVGGEYTEFSIEFSDVGTYSWTKSSPEVGTWTYEEATGRLELTPTSGAGDISTRTIWFVLFEEEKKGFFDEEPKDVYRYFMENRDADGLISSSFGEWNRTISLGDR